MNEKLNDKTENTLDEKTLSDATGGWEIRPFEFEQCSDCPHGKITPYRDASGRMVVPCYECYKLI